MTWIVRNKAKSILWVESHAMMFKVGEEKNLDLFGGRENIENSRQIQDALRSGLLETVHKDEVIDPNKPVPVITVQKEMPKEHIDTINRLETQNKELHEHGKTLENKLNEQQQQNIEIINNTNKLMEEMKAFASNFPVQLQNVTEALKNINLERAAIVREKEELKNDTSISDAEMRVRERILAAKDKKLEANAENLGKQVTKNSSDLSSQIQALKDIGF